ncbi:hypothetical protein B0T14DRAFT_505456 [Immersiella caudata]|uniref:Uncharacterized protein n=1 Tax=Immersiella caudata TaxID=314043 RepID=A0AA39XFC4_9PEZI|nr:hypothetical protein B0T14DRAFT_505456 [Immersiella caudata]
MVTKIVAQTVPRFATRQQPSWRQVGVRMPPNHVRYRSTQGSHTPTKGAPFHTLSSCTMAFTVHTIPGLKSLPTSSF